MDKAGILGSAIVGQTLARGFKRHGYEVRIGSRTPSKLAAFSAESGIEAGTFADVARKMTSPEARRRTAYAQEPTRWRAQPCMRLRAPSPVLSDLPDSGCR